ncbi:unnamed protein product [Lactuca virosa]|uniref:Uncharacterized protein n=1 Tax=Lactuca virosa TaxID=75947 RepID=A0AAU9P293_9ASTR|nr:unnamed protein product [Lactuca virosa]
MLLSETIVIRNGHGGRMFDRDPTSASILLDTEGDKSEFFIAEFLIVCSDARIDGRRPLGRNVGAGSKNDDDEQGKNFLLFDFYLSSLCV